MCTSSDSEWEDVHFVHLLPILNEKLHTLPMTFFEWKDMFSTSSLDERCTVHCTLSLQFWDEKKCTLPLTLGEKICTSFNSGWAVNLLTSDEIIYPLFLTLDDKTRPPPPPLSFWMRKCAICHSRWQGICTLPLYSTLIKKKIKFSSYVGKFRVEQLQSHEEGLPNIWGNAEIFPHIWGGR